MASNISVTWETVGDGKTRQGANLRHNLKELIESGYSLDVETPDGTKTFTDAGAFCAWFDAVGAAARSHGNRIMSRTRQLQNFPSDEVPLGLLVAEALLPRIASSGADLARHLRDQALSNLAWAEADMQSEPFALRADEIPSRIAAVRLALTAPT